MRLLKKEAQCRDLIGAGIGAAEQALLQPKAAFQPGLVGSRPFASKDALISCAGPHIGAVNCHDFAGSNVGWTVR